MVPVHKKKSKSVPSNYRPVSLLSLISKVMETVINSFLVSHLEKEGILSANQFGFRRGLGTADLLTSLQHEWSTTASQGGAVRVLAIDIAGAFDKVSHLGVLSKLSSYGVAGNLLSWLQSYLSSRSLRVVLGGQQSSLKPIAAGVPQGSILGPTLFLTYVNDCEEAIPSGVGLAVYADDTTVYQKVPSHKELEASSGALQTAVDAVFEWGNKWKIKFEPSKSQALTIAYHRIPWDFPPILFGGITVLQADSIRLLGVLFDEHLSYKEHIRSVATRANSRLYFLRRAAPLLDSNGRTKLYKGFVRPVIEYSPLVWLGASDTALGQLSAVQRRALHILGPGVLLQSLPARRKVAALSYLYKLQCLDGPSRLTSMVPPRQPIGSPISICTRQQATSLHPFQFATTIDRKSRNSGLAIIPLRSDP